MLLRMAGARAPKVLLLHCVKGLVCSVKNGGDGVGILRASGNADADRQFWRLGIEGEEFTDAAGDQSRGSLVGFGQDHGEFVTALASGGIDRAATILQDASEATEHAVSGEMTGLVVDGFEAVEVQQEQGEIAAGALGAADFGVEHLKKAAMIGQTS